MLLFFVLVDCSVVYSPYNLLLYKSCNPFCLWRFMFCSIWSGKTCHVYIIFLLELLILPRELPPSIHRQKIQIPSPLSACCPDGSVFLPSFLALLFYCCVSSFLLYLLIVVLVSFDCFWSIFSLFFFTQVLLSLSPLGVFFLGGVFWSPDFIWGNRVVLFFSQAQSGFFFNKLSYLLNF